MSALPDTVAPPQQVPPASALGAASEGAPPRRRPRGGQGAGWIVYLAAGAVALTIFLLVPGARVGPAFNLICLSAPVVIVFGVRLQSGRQRLVWYLVSLGLILFVAGDVITYNYQRFFGTEPPYPSIGDLFYLLVYPFLIAGILLMLRRRSPGRDQEGLIDSLIVGIGIGVISWVFLIAPYVHDATLTLTQKLVAMAYPVMDLVLITVTVRLAVGAGKRQMAFYLIAASLAVLFVTDSIYGWIVLHGGYDNTTGYLEGGWGLFYLLFGAAALHYSVRVLEEPTPRVDPKHSRVRLLILAGASLMAPAVSFVLSMLGKAVDVPVVSAAGMVLFVLVLVRLNGLMVDISEYRRTSRLLQEAETKYRSLVEGLPAVVYIADFGEEGAWRYVSPQIETILGFTRDEFMSGPRFWRERIVPEDRQRALEAEENVLRRKGRLQCEYRILARSGEVMWIREEADALQDDEGTPLYLQGVMFDITELKHAEQQLVKSLAIEKEASARLRSLHEMQNSFLQAVSHDLRTPLTSILGIALTLERDEGKLSPEDSKDLLRRVAANARKLHRLLTNLLDLDRLTRGVLKPNRQEVDLAGVARTVLEEMQDDSHSIILVTTEEVTASIDPPQVERIIENLVANAVRYTPAGTRIWVSVARHQEGVLIAVDDEGPGVPLEGRESIFEPFRQGSAVIAHSPGVGIGLSLVSKFAELHDGRSWVEDRPGGGASFKVYLPDSSPTPARAPVVAEFGETGSPAGQQRSA